MSNYITIAPTACTRFNHIVKKFCLPKKTDCNKTIIDGFFTDCDNIWGCGLCSSDKEYFIPIPEDGKVMIQTNYNHSDTESGWGDFINIYYVDVDGDETIVPEEAILNKIIARSTKHHYQTIEIDVSQIEISCFKFVIKSTGNTDLCTQYFKKESCFNLVSFEGIFKDFDCMNNYYGYPVGDYSGDLLKYSNKFYLKGSIKKLSFGSESEIIRFTPSELVPPFMAAYISNKLMKAKNVKVNDESYTPIETELTAREKSNMFWTILEFTKKGCSGNSGLCG